MSLDSGYRIVTDTGRDCNVKIPNLQLHVFGGQQLVWPPTKVKESDSIQVDDDDILKALTSQRDPKKELYIYEMGFSLVVKEMISAKKPIIGHNCMYDLLYLYNQFIDELPSTFNEFVLKWNTLFPETFDSKVLAKCQESS